MTDHNREDLDLLAGACDALGKIMMALAGRRLLVNARNPVIAARARAEALNDSQLETIAANAFEAAALALAKAGYPGAQAFMCNPTEEP